MVGKPEVPQGFYKSVLYIQHIHSVIQPIGQTAHPY